MSYQLSIGEKRYKEGGIGQVKQIQFMLPPANSTTNGLSFQEN
jgi:hypothetical protein